MTPKFRTALYPGSFRPFTTGHRDIAVRALRLCDRLVIGVGHNPAKDCDDAEVRAEAIRQALADFPQVEVRVYEGLTADFARECGADFLVRGIRSVSDFDAERTLAEVNLKVGGIDTVLLCADPALSYVSASMVRELESFGYDASRFKA